MHVLMYTGGMNIHRSLPPDVARPPGKQRVVQVLTPLAACVLFGRSGEAVRRAAREGLVITRLALAFTSKQVRLLDLNSAVHYWGRGDRRKYRQRIEEEVTEMRNFGVTILYEETEYRVLHPYPLVPPQYTLNMADDLDLL